MPRLRQNLPTSLTTIEVLDAYVFINRLRWQSSGILIFFGNYYIVISDTLVYSFLDVLFLLLAVIRASWETKKERFSYRKKYIEEFVWRILLFWQHALLSMSVCCFLCLFPPTFQEPCSRNGPYKDIYIAMCGILCDDIMRKQSKIGKSPAI